MECVNNRKYMYRLETTDRTTNSFADELNLQHDLETKIFLQPLPNYEADDDEFSDKFVI